MRKPLPISLWCQLSEGGVESEWRAEIEGMVDKESQHATWVVSGRTSPIMETGIYSLTKDDAPALLHFEDGQTQQWLLVRLDDPKEGADSK